MLTSKASNIQEDESLSAIGSPMPSLNRPIGMGSVVFTKIRLAALF